MTALTQYKVGLILLILSCLTLNACVQSPTNQAQHGPAKVTKSFANKSQQSAIVKSPNDNREYAVVVLDNQLEVVLVSDPNIEKSAAALSVAVGSLQDPKAFQGLAHFLEHMLLLSTEDYPKVGSFSEFINQHGGTHNAETQLNKTNFMMAVDNSAYDQALARFSRFFYQAKFDPSTVEKERQAVHAEWKMRQPNDWVKLEQLNGYTLNPAHPISQFSWGNLASLQDNQQQSLLQAVQQMYQQYYSANLMKATLISPLPIKQMTQLATKHFSNIANKRRPKPQLEMPVATAEHFNKLVRYLPQSDMQQLRIEFVLNTQPKQQKYNPYAYVQYLLTNEMPGSLASHLREQGLSEALYVTYDQHYYNNAGSFSLYIDLTRTGVQNRDYVMAATLKYLTKLQTDGVNKRYFKEIQQSLSNAFRFKEKINDYNYATHIASALHDVPANYVLSSEYSLTAFKPKAIDALLKQLTLAQARVFYIDKNQATDTTMPHFLGQYKVQSITPEMQAKWQDMGSSIDLSLPRPNTLLPERFDLVKARYTNHPMQLKTSAAYSAFLGHSALFQQPKGITVFELNTGIHQASIKNQVLSYLLEHGLNQQLTQLSAEAQAAGMGLHFGVANGLSFTLSGFTDKQINLLDQALTQLQNFSMSQSQLTNLKAKLKGELASLDQQNLLQQARQKLDQLLHLKSADKTQWLAELDSISSQDVNLLKQQLISEAKLRLLAFGNYAEQNVQEMAKITLTRLPLSVPAKPDSQPYYQSPIVNLSAGGTYSWKQNSQLADVALIDVYLLPKTPQDLAAARVLDRFIHSAFVQQIRTQEQLAYDLSFDGKELPHSFLIGFYIQSPVIGLEKLQQRIEQFSQGFSTQLSQFSAQQFIETKAGLITTLSQPAKNLTEEMNQYYADWLAHNTQFDSRKNLLQALEKTNLKDVVALYKKLLSGQHMPRIMLQLRGSQFQHQNFAQPAGAKEIKTLGQFHQLSKP
ncbi:insulinase family protein [Paraglaciecola aestuariivivens]